MRSVIRVLRPFVAAFVLFAATGQSHATTVVTFTGLGTFTTPSLSTGGVIVTGSANVNVDNLNGLGIVGGTSDFFVNFGEFMSFSFTSPSVTDVGLRFGAIGGAGTANTDIEAFQPGGASLGTLTRDLFSETTNPFWDISALFGDVALESFTLTPLNTNLGGAGTNVRASRISFVPEPSTALLFASGLVAMAAGRRRRI